jgi:hypothetical protein
MGQGDKVRGGNASQKVNMPRRQLASRRIRPRPDFSDGKVASVCYVAFVESNPKQ